MVPFAETLSVLLQAPISLRKLIINSMQIGDNTYDEDIAYQFKRYLYRNLEGESLQAPEFMSHLNYVRQSTMMRSLTWMFARTVPEPKDRDESEEIYKLGFYKEFDASQNPDVYGPAFNWSDFGFGSHVPENIDYPWHAKLRRIAGAFHSYCLRRLRGMLFPHVNRVKNVSRETAQNAIIFRGDWEPGEVTTQKLELLYADTGFKAPGPCEMRTAWKFNDLKPRYYYAQGGSSYFASRYCKPLAVALMESVPCTGRRLRTSPDVFLSSDEDDYVCTWDFTSFTTNLSELKFFLYHLTNALEDLKPVEFMAFDYHSGQETLNLVDMLRDYNQEVNCLAEFTVYRVLDRFAYEHDTPRATQVFQQQNGMLGVAGNIGFSTACHGSVMEKAQGSGVCVGDDGLKITKIPPMVELIPIITTLGEIELSKFGIIAPQTMEQALRFVKRRLSRDAYGQITIDKLFNFPISAYIDEVYGHRTVPPGLTDLDRYIKIGTQTGKLLWDVNALSPLVSDEDYELLIRTINIAYQYMGIPRTGIYSGGTITLNSHKYPFYHFIPSLVDSFGMDLDFRSEDWLDEMLRHWPSHGIRAQVYAPTFIPPLPSVDETIFVTRNRCWKALEDLGLVTLKPVYETFHHPNEDHRRTIMKNLGRLVSREEAGLYEMHVLQEIPSKFEFVFNTVPIEIVDYRMLASEI